MVHDCRKVTIQVIYNAGSWFPVYSYSMQGFVVNVNTTAQAADPTVPGRNPCRPPGIRHRSCRTECPPASSDPSGTSPDRNSGRWLAPSPAAEYRHLAEGLRGRIEEEEQKGVKDFISTIVQVVSKLRLLLSTVVVIYIYTYIYVCIYIFIPRGKVKNYEWKMLNIYNKIAEHIHLKRIK